MSYSKRKPAHRCINSHTCKENHEILHFSPQSLVCIAVVWRYGGGWSDVERVEKSGTWLKGWDVNSMAKLKSWLVLLEREA